MNLRRLYVRLMLKLSTRCGVSVHLRCVQRENGGFEMYEYWPASSQRRDDMEAAVDLMVNNGYEICLGDPPREVNVRRKISKLRYRRITRFTAERIYSKAG